MVIIFVAGPVLFTNRGFNLEFTNALWLAHVQASTLGSGIFPSYFLNTSGTVSAGIFNPMFAFYGGTLYALIGEFARLFNGNVVLALDVLVVGLIVYAYFGLYWICRQLGIAAAYSHFVPITYVTSAYFITILYGRGDVAEFAAVGVFPMVVAGGLALLQEPNWSPKATVLFASGLVIFTGSHNISLVWGTSLLLVLLVLELVVVRPKVAWRRIGRILVIAVPAVMLNGWFLVPDLLYGRDTAIAASNGVSGFFFDSYRLLFNFLRTVPDASTTPGLFVQVPVYMLLWAVAVGGAAVFSAKFRSLRRPFFMLAVMFGVILGLIMDSALWRSMPSPWSYIQLPYRLVSYLTLIIAGFVGIGVFVTERLVSEGIGRGIHLDSLLRVSLVAAVAMSFALCAWQLWIPRTLPKPVGTVSGYADRYDVVASIHATPKSWYAVGDYADRSQPTISVSPGEVMCEVAISPEKVNSHGDGVSTVVLAPWGSGPIKTNIVAGPYLAVIGGGVARIGTSPNGLAVVARREPGTESGNAVIKGWAVDDKKLEPAKEVLAVKGDRVIAMTRPDIYRADVAKYLASKATAYSGFLLKVPAYMIQQHLQIYTLNSDDTVSRLSGLSSCVSPIEFGRTLQFVRGENGILYRVQASSGSPGYVDEIELPVLITVNTARSFGVIAGRVSSVFASCMFLGLAVYLAPVVRRRRRF